MSMSLKQIRYFLAAAEKGQVSLAASSLNVSQSTVTTALQQLELELGVSLFRRLPSGVELTAQGSRFLAQARNVMAAVSAAQRAPLTEDRALRGVVRVCVTYTVAGYFLPPHYAHFARAYPDIRVELTELPRPQIEQGLKEGAFDLAVMLVSNLRDRENLAAEILFRSRRRLWLPVEHPLLSAESVTLEDVARLPYVVLTVDEANETAARFWAPTGFSPNAIFVTSSVEAVRSMVADGLGVTVLSDMVYRRWSLEGQRIEQRNVTTPVPTMDVGLAWRADTKLGAAARAFADFLSLSVNGGA
ncbi:MAG TPA: LysR family transcriptional regulator [Roseiarcus sp.]|nr:LysR family transcriptional regulator [Roseiarcus sp.]